MTIQQFIKHARSLRNPLVLEHSIIFHEAIESAEGSIHRGKNNETMRKLRRLGYFTLDRKSCSIPGWDPTWYITPAGREILKLEQP